jgi:glycosyltransferase involved in cell wall biosynthesis
LIAQLHEIKSGAAQFYTMSSKSCQRQTSDPARSANRCCFFVGENCLYSGTEMKIAFVGHSYHKVTSSSRWFIEYLQKHGDTQIYWDDAWIGGQRLALDDIVDADRIFIWQVEYVARELAHIMPDKVVFIPMWDGVSTFDKEWWQGLGRVRILCFAWILFQRLRSWHFNAFHAQFYPDPSAFRVIEDFSSFRGYLWQRRPEISWSTVRALAPSLKWDHFQLHIGMDPGSGEIVPPSSSECRRSHINLSRFTKDVSTSGPVFGNANVYFAPRVSEGIGMSFLEAMACGCCVVAANAPTMSEYIDHNVSGLLYDPQRPVELNFSRFAELGAAARRSIENGFTDWVNDLANRLPDVLFPDGSSIIPPRTLQIKSLAHIRSIPASIAPNVSPKLTIAIVTFNAEEAFETTLSSILGQTFQDYEIVVVDGGSSDGTIGLIETHRSMIAKWISEPDNGPYDAMNKAAKLARGTYISYINAGDYLSSPYALDRAFAGAPRDADFIIGHHIYVTSEGVERLQKAAAFEDTWQNLLHGRLSTAWLCGVPFHQATLTRRSLLLAENGYASAFLIAADLEFMCRARSKGAKFHHCGEILSIYTTGGFSSKSDQQRVQEWWKIARMHGNREKVDQFFRNTFPISYEIDAWSIATAWRYVVHNAKTTLSRWKDSIRKINRERLQWQRRTFSKR